MDLPVLVTRRETSGYLVHRASREGRLVPLLPGVYARSDVAADPMIRAAAVGRWNPTAIVHGRAAARASFWPEVAVDLIDVAAQTNLERPGYRFTRRRLPGELCGRFQGVRVSLPALTALDLAPETDGASLDHVLRSRLASIDDLRDAFALTRRRRGNAERARLLLDSRAEPWSVPERMTHVLLRKARMTGWRANLPVVVRGRRYYLDVGFPTLRLAVEIDGRAFHTAPDVFESDRVRQNDLVLAGWTVLRFTYQRLLADPSGVLAEISAGCRRAARRR